MQLKPVLAFGLIVIAAFSFPAAAQVVGLPTAEQVLSKYVEALGGRENILKLTSRVMAGKFEVDGAEGGTVEVFYKTPNLFHSIVNINTYGVLDSGHDARGGWEKPPDGPLRPQTGSDLARSRRELDLHKAVKVAQLYRSVTAKGRGQSGGRPAWLLLAVPAVGHAETMYFDQETGLLLQVDLKLDTDGEAVAVARFYEDYRDVGGVKVAHTIRFINPGMSYTLRFNTVQHNVVIPQTKLARPQN